MISADALSRAVNINPKEEEGISRENINKILQIRNELNHRKTILDKVERAGIKI